MQNVFPFYELDNKVIIIIIFSTAWKNTPHLCIATTPRYEFKYIVQQRDVDKFTGELYFTYTLEPLNTYCSNTNTNKNSAIIFTSAIWERVLSGSLCDVSHTKATM